MVGAKRRILASSGLNWGNLVCAFAVFLVPQVFAVVAVYVVSVGFDGVKPFSSVHPENSPEERFTVDFHRTLLPIP